MVEAWQLRGDIDILRLERDAEGTLRVLIADMKSSTNPKIEHRLQIAFYHRMIAALFAAHQIPCAEIRIGILYRGPAGDTKVLKPEEAAGREAQRYAAELAFGASAGYLEIVANPEPYLDAVADLVTAPGSTAVRVGSTAFDELPFHLTYKCDGCLYNEFCMKWSAQHDDLSLLPHLTAQDKGAFQRHGVHTMRHVADLKVLPPADQNGGTTRELIPVASAADLVRKLATTWPIGPRVDELIHRALRYRSFKGDPVESLSYIPSKGYGSLPFSSAEHNPNLVRIFIDAQHDYLNDRIYMLGALLVGCEAGEPRPERRRSVVHLTEGPPDTSEREQELFVAWIRDVLAALLAVAAPDPDGELTAPVHLIFFNRFDQQLVLDGLSRHAGTILGATPLYDFITQLAAFDSPLVTFLDQEIRELKNYPMVCQSLQAVAASLKFDWNMPEPYRQLFRSRMFDFWGKLDDHEQTGESPWYFSRARFNSQIPLEYAYAAWDDLPMPGNGADPFGAYRHATTPLLLGFHARRLEALEHITADFKGNKQTLKTPFDLGSIATFSERARTLAHALDEFVMIERHVDLAAWKAARLAPPERRVLAGDALVGSFHECEQDADTNTRNRENVRRFRRKVELMRTGAELSKEEKQELKWSQDGMRVRLRFDAPLECSIDEMLGLKTLREGDRVVVCPRWDVDSRLPVEEQVPYTPTPKQLLYGTRATIIAIRVQRDDHGRAVSGTVELEMRSSFGGKGMRGFVFGSMDKPFEDGAVYSIDQDPNDWYGYHSSKVTEELCAGGHNTL
ncbi:MAG: superfamily helicase, partial [Chloroflexi bacterium]|nr:superfamily helicase [Chloroflexota bacterium]